MLAVIRTGYEVVSSRSMRRSLGKREARRNVRKDVVKAIELAREGFSPKTISTILRVPESLVVETLRLASEVEEAQAIAMPLPPAGGTGESESGGSA